MTVIGGGGHTVFVVAIARRAALADCRVDSIERRRVLYGRHVLIVLGVVHRGSQSFQNLRAAVLGEHVRHVAEVAAAGRRAFRRVLALPSINQGESKSELRKRQAKRDQKQRATSGHGEMKEEGRSQEFMRSDMLSLVYLTVLERRGVDTPSHFVECT